MEVTLLRQVCYNLHSFLWLLGALACTQQRAQGDMIRAEALCFHPLK